MRKKSGKRQEQAQNSAKKINEPVKKILKGPIKYDITLNEEQKLAKATIHSNTITIVTGKAGSGKTLLACAYALDELFKKQIGKIYITRPTVTREAMGFLPGDITQKLDPFLIPIYENLKQLCNDKICFSKMTFPHQLIRVFLLEQIFRAFKISNNEKYHH